MSDLHFSGWPFSHNYSLFQLALVPVLFPEKKINVYTSKQLVPSRVLINLNTLYSGRGKAWGSQNRCSKIEKVRKESWPPTVCWRSASSWCKWNYNNDGNTVMRYTINPETKSPMLRCCWIYDTEQGFLFVTIYSETVRFILHNWRQFIDKWNESTQAITSLHLYCKHM